MGKIRIYTDESVNVAIAEGLKRRGVDTFTAQEAGSLGLTDEEQLLYAKKMKAIIFTHDIDFLKISAEWTAGGRSHNGIVYCHQSRYPVGECIRKLRMLSEVLSSEDMVDHIEFL